MERWQQYFKELLNLKDGGDDNIVNNITEELEPNILLAEIENSIQIAPSNKAPGPNNIQVELIKTAVDIGIK